jgi:hypothetical protein
MQPSHRTASECQAIDVVHAAGVQQPNPGSHFDVTQFVVVVANLIEKPRHLGEDSIRLARMVNLMAG